MPSLSNGEDKKKWKEMVTIGATPGSVTTSEIKQTRNSINKLLSVCPYLLLVTVSQFFWRGTNLPQTTM